MFQTESEQQCLIIAGVVKKKRTDIALKFAVFTNTKECDIFLRLRCIQAQFADLNLASYSDSGTMVDIQVYREGTVVVR